MSEMAPEAPESTTEETAAPTFTQEQVKAIAAKEKREATNSFVKELGFSKADELKEALSAFKQHQEQQKTNEQRLVELQQQNESLTGQTSKYQEVMQSLVDREMEAIPEDRRTLVPEGDPVSILDYITKNRQFLTGKSAPVSVGSASAPAPTAPQSPVSYEEFKKLKPVEMNDLAKQYPEVVQNYAEKLRRGD